MSDGTESPSRIDVLSEVLAEAIPRVVYAAEIRSMQQERAEKAKMVERLCAASVNAPAGVRSALDATIVKLLGEINE